MLHSLNETSMTAKCPECHEKMRFKVGLTPPTGDNIVVCPGCGKSVMVLALGPILDGPISLSN
jgi:hypothetical protein